MGPRRRGRRALARAGAARRGSPPRFADVGIALLLLCDCIGLDFTEAIADKLAKNAVRYPADKSRGRADRPT